MQVGLAVSAEMEVGIIHVAIVNFVPWEEMLAMVALNLVEQIGIVTNDNPIGLHIGNEIVSVHLGRSWKRGELWLARQTMDCHDIKIKKRKEFYWMCHVIKVSQFAYKVKPLEQVFFKNA